MSILLFGVILLCNLILKCEGTSSRVWKQSILIVFRLSSLNFECLLQFWKCTISIFVCLIGGIVHTTWMSEDFTFFQKEMLEMLGQIDIISFTANV